MLKFDVHSKQRNLRVFSVDLQIPCSIGRALYTRNETRIDELSSRFTANILKAVNRDKEPRLEDFVQDQRLVLSIQNLFNAGLASR